MPTDSNRANSVNPIYDSLNNVEDKIATCERIFTRQGLRPAFKITPFVSPANLDVLLEQLNYSIIHPTSVQAINLAGIDKPYLVTIKTSNEFDELWFDDYAHLNNLGVAQRNTYRKMLKHLVPKNYYVSLLIEGNAVACGRVVIEHGHAGLFDLNVHESHRHNGYGTQLV